MHVNKSTKHYDFEYNFRILANRQSAQRSRVRKLHYISELERSVSTLQVIKNQSIYCFCIVVILFVSIYIY